MFWLCLKFWFMKNLIGQYFHKIYSSTGILSIWFHHRKRPPTLFIYHSKVLFESYKMMPTYLGKNIGHTLKLCRALVKRLHFIEFYRIFSMFSVIKIIIVAVKLWYSKSARKNGYIYVIFNNFCWLFFFSKIFPYSPSGMD